MPAACVLVKGQESHGDLVEETDDASLRGDILYLVGKGALAIVGHHQDVTLVLWIVKVVNELYRIV